MQPATLRKFQDAVVIITGGASGLGLALGEALAQRGAIVVLADRQIELAEERAQQIQQQGGRAEAVELDVTDYSSVEQVVKQTRESHNRIDYFFNNAGIVIAGETEFYQPKDWDQVLSVNINGVANGVQAVYPIMREQRFGHIINMASVAGLIPLAGLVSYSTSKHAVVGMSTCLRIEAAFHGVNVSVICPGAVETPIVGGGKFGKILNPLPEKIQRHLWEKNQPISPEKFAQSALKGVKKNKAIIVVPWRWKLLWWIYRLAPSLGMYLARKRFESTKREVEKLIANKDQLKAGD